MRERQERAIPDIASLYPGYNSSVILRCSPKASLEGWRHARAVALRARYAGT
jgi:hypothetical protein